MRDLTCTLTGACAGLLLAASPLWAGADAGLPNVDEALEGHLRVRLADDARPARAFHREGRILSLYGRTFANGVSPRASAEEFLARHLEVFGVDADDLREGVSYGGGAFEKGLRYNPDTGEYRFTLLRYSQYAGDVPVYNSELKLLVRNEPGHALVLANANLRPLGDFEADLTSIRIDRAAAQRVAVRELGRGSELLEDPEPVVWAGLNTDVEAPRLGVKFRARYGEGADESKWMYIVDAATGALLYAEDLIYNVDVEGSVSANVTEGFKANICSDFVQVPLPYARVNVGGTVAYADENGDFVIPNGGGGAVTVESRVWGLWFRVFNNGGPNALLSQNVTPPGPADFVHNPSLSEFTTAEVDCYLHANIVRDYVLDIDPSFPVIGTQRDFTVNVNINSSCNATYSGSAINFYRALGGCPNEGFSTIVYHEYGHHIVAIATGSQCQWGEGNSDVMALLVSDEPQLAWGFFGDCDQPLRNADNECQYDSQSCSSCGGPCHSCGQLISGCAWSLRDNLLETEPTDYRRILSELAIGSLFLHNTGQSITPADTVNYLTLDDDDGDLENGTPHYFEIANAFNDHNMDAPRITFLTFDTPNGLPETVSPGGGTTVQLAVMAEIGDPEPDSGILHVDDGNGFVEYPMVEIETNLYEGTFPATDCGNTVDYFFTVDTTGGIRVAFPADGADDPILVLAADGTITTFQDDFETDLGWTVVENVQWGDWQRGVPVDCGRGDPPTDADGSGQCYLTGNEPECRNVDFGATTLTSPILDASDPNAQVSYYRWYDTGDVRRDDPFVIEVSDDAGASWAELEVIAPESPEAEGGWIFVAYLVSDFVSNTDQFQIRFTASDTGNFSTVEAAVDAVTVQSLICGACTEDLDSSGSVDFGDILAVLSAWGACEGCPEDLDGSGAVDFGDILAILSAWGPCE